MDFFCFFVMFCFATVHIAAALKTFKKLLKKKKKRENILKKDKQLHLVFNVWLSASIFHVFGVFLICRSVQTGCVPDFLQEANNPAWSRPRPVPICSYSMKSCTWPFCSNKCAIFINRLRHAFHFTPRAHSPLLWDQSHSSCVLSVGGTDRWTKHLKKITKTNRKAKPLVPQEEMPLNENGTGGMQNTKKAV